MKLNRSFFIRPTLKVARDLLGKYIIRRIAAPSKKGRASPRSRSGREKLLVGKIVETEAYIGPQDRASHAYGGKITPRNKAEWMIGGHIYIYLVYGMYWQLNISTGKAGSPECVLIRALEPVSLSRLTNPKHEIRNPKQIPNTKIQNSKLVKLANGPGKLCRWLRLDKTFYGEDVTKSKRIWLASPPSRGGLASPKGRTNLKKSQIKSGPRIGIDYAGPKWSKKPWRFWIKDNLCVSKI